MRITETMFSSKREDLNDEFTEMVLAFRPFSATTWEDSINDNVWGFCARTSLPLVCVENWALAVTPREASQDCNCPGKKGVA